MSIIRPASRPTFGRSEAFSVQGVPCASDSWQKKARTRALFTPGQDEKILKITKTEHPTVAFYDSFRTFEVTIRRKRRVNFVVV